MSDETKGTEPAVEEEAPGGGDVDREAPTPLDREMQEAVREALAQATAPEPVDDGELERLRRELAELRDRSLRNLADFDNYRKRVERERAEERRYAGLPAVRDILTVVDDLERALAAGGSAEDLRAGVQLILRHLEDVLRRHGVARLDAAGAPFDPRWHEAVSRHEDPEATLPTVSEELRAGYRMHERLLRPAMVRVAMPLEAALERAEVEDDGHPGEPPDTP